MNKILLIIVIIVTVVIVIVIIFVIKRNRRIRDEKLYEILGEYIKNGDDRDKFYIELMGDIKVTGITLELDEFKMRSARILRYQKVFCYIVMNYPYLDNYKKISVNLIEYIKNNLNMNNKESLNGDRVIFALKSTMEDLSYMKEIYDDIFTIDHQCPYLVDYNRLHLKELDKLKSGDIIDTFTLWITNEIIVDIQKDGSPDSLYNILIRVSDEAKRVM